MPKINKNAFPTEKDLAEAISYSLDREPFSDKKGVIKSLGKDKGCLVTHFFEPDEDDEEDNDDFHTIQEYEIIIKKKGSPKRVKY